eukprot:scaffold4304_cov58-Phaeocystis_antarctica.AAC.13
MPAQYASSKRSEESGLRAARKVPSASLSPVRAWGCSLAHIGLQPCSRGIAALRTRGRSLHRMGLQPASTSHG